jgi:hypothetical protein
MGKMAENQLEQQQLDLQAWRWRIHDELEIDRALNRQRNYLGDFEVEMLKEDAMVWYDKEVEKHGFVDAATLKAYLSEVIKQNRRGRKSLLACGLKD